MDGHPDWNVYLLGYSGLTPDALAAVAAARNWAVLDIRMSPYSRIPGWGGPALRELMGHHYIHVPELGNVNYKGGGPIKLANPEQGMNRLIAHLNVVPVVLLCGCAQVETCHRLVAGRLANETFGVPVVSLAPGDIYWLAEQLGQG